MFELMIYHNYDCTLSRMETIEELEDNGLKVISVEFDNHNDEWEILVQGTQEQFIKWNDSTSECSPSWDQVDITEDLEPV